MKESYLEVTFRRGRVIAAYYYLPRRPGQRSYRTEEVEPGILVDYSRSGKPIGIEITNPRRVSLAAMNRILRRLKQPPMKREELAPLKAA
jgi:uncharacterized protein YuzE